MSEHPAAPGTGSRLVMDGPLFGATSHGGLDMGAMADAMRDYAQPLLDETDGSLKGLQKALTLGMYCWNLSLRSKDDQEKDLRELQPSLEMGDDEFADFRRSIIEPMILRHHRMFPEMHPHFRPSAWQESPWRTSAPAPQFSPLTFEHAPWQDDPVVTVLRPVAGTSAHREKYPGTDRYAPCPCESGKKYKFCCGARGT
jgi:SEC-C motif